MNRKNILRCMSALYAAFLTLLFAANSFAGNLSIDVTGIRSERGNIMVGLYTSVKNYKADIQADGLLKKAIEGEETINVPNLDKGNYIVAIFHDENNNGKLDTNWLGIPDEGYGFSNNPSSRFGPPDMKRSVFQVDAAGVRRISIQLKY